MKAMVACARPGWEAYKGTCGGCGIDISGGRAGWFCGKECAQLWRNNHWWGDARETAIRHQKRCQKCGYMKGLEVNHIVPRNGAGYRTDCAHHQDGLEVLCHGCHLGVTAEQRQARKVAL